MKEFYSDKVIHNNPLIKLSIIILTMNRSDYLDRCLSSLAGQLTKKDEVLVLLDSNIKDNSIEILDKYLQKLPLIYYVTAIKGYPLLYNEAIRISSKEVLVFINDDCEVDPTFIASLKETHQRRPNCVIQGMTYSLPKRNIYAEIMGDNYKNWIAINKIKGLKDRMKTIDNKNVSIPRNIFSRVGGYDNRFSGGSEDIEFGHRLYDAKIPIIFDPAIIVYHFERSTLSGFVRQHIRIGRSESKVDRIIGPSEKIGMISWKKAYLHLRSAVIREMKFIKEYRIIDFVYLPFLYILLFCIRIYAYKIKTS